MSDTKLSESDQRLLHAAFRKYRGAAWSSVSSFIAEHDEVVAMRMETVENSGGILPNMSPGQYFHEAMDYVFTTPDVDSEQVYTQGNFSMIENLILEAVSLSLYQSGVKTFATENRLFNPYGHQYTREEANNIFRQIVDTAYLPGDARLEVRLSGGETYNIRLQDIHRYLAGRMDGQFYSEQQTGALDCANNPKTDDCQLIENTFAQAAHTARLCGDEIRNASVTWSNPINKEAPYFVGVNDAIKLEGVTPKTLEAAGAKAIVQAGKCLIENNRIGSAPSDSPKTPVTGGEAVASTDGTPPSTPKADTQENTQSAGSGAPNSGTSHAPQR